MASLLAPLAMEVGDLRGYRRQGRQATGLFLAMFTGVRPPRLLSSAPQSLAIPSLQSIQPRSKRSSILSTGS